MDAVRFAEGLPAVAGLPYPQPVAMAEKIVDVVKADVASGLSLPSMTPHFSR
jgi:hypothetical protein